MLPPMTVSRELDDITRNLVRHTHEHPPVRDVNQEVERRTSRAERARISVHSRRALRSDGSR